jgi:hypothetical protein
MFFGTGWRILMSRSYLIPGFLSSRWTEEELARANSSNIQILQVLWPGQPEGAGGAFSTFLPLELGNFTTADTLARRYD